MEAFVYSSMGRVEESAARGLHVVWFVSLLGIFYIVARRVMSRTAALFWTVVLSAIPNLALESTQGLGNVVLGSFLFAGMAALDRWRRERHDRVLAAAAILLGLASLCRDEGFPLALILITAFMVTTASMRGSGLRKVALQTAGLALGTFAIRFLWTSLVRRYPIGDLMSGWLTFDIFSRSVSHFRDLPDVLQMALQELAIPEFQTQSLHFEKVIGLALFWPAFAIAATRLFLVRDRDRFALGCAVTSIAGVLMYTGGFWLFPYQNLADLRDNWMFVMDRHLLCLIPFATYVIAWSISGDNLSAELFHQDHPHRHDDLGLTAKDSAGGGFEWKILSLAYISERSQILIDTRLFQKEPK
jgi:4-amino-4-deoxy-L-arabinose transferase-like glycosyltransferase